VCSEATPTWGEAERKQDQVLVASFAPLDPAVPEADKLNFSVSEIRKFPLHLSFFFFFFFW
jgi:hypothetical protein